MKICSKCGDNPASVFTPNGPVCKPCHRDIKRAEREDLEIDNFEVDECGELVSA